MRGAICHFPSERLQFESAVAADAAALLCPGRWSRPVTAIDGLFTQDGGLVCMAWACLLPKTFLKHVYFKRLLVYLLFLTCQPLFTCFISAGKQEPENQICAASLCSRRITGLQCFSCIPIWVSCTYKKTFHVFQMQLYYLLIIHCCICMQCAVRALLFLSSHKLGQVRIPDVFVTAGNITQGKSWILSHCSSLSLHHIYKPMIELHLSDRQLEFWNSTLHFWGFLFC